jgi:hypothetical protein
MANKHGGVRVCKVGDALGEEEEEEENGDGGAVKWCCCLASSCEVANVT